MLPQLTKEGLGFRDLSDEDMDGSVLFFIQPDQTGGLAIGMGPRARPHVEVKDPITNNMWGVSLKYGPFM